MKGKPFRDNRLQEAQMRSDAVNSRQEIHSADVAPVSESLNVNANADSPRSSWSNSSESKQMQSFAVERRTPNSYNILSGNELEPSAHGADREETYPKCKRAVRMVVQMRWPLTRWLKFNFVGGIGIGVQFVALFFLKSILHFNYLAATTLAVEAAVVHNFVWHERFTWADRVQASWRSSLPRLARFNLTTGAVSIVGNLALMKVMVGFGHMNYLAANAIAIVLCSLANFLVSEEWVFER